MQTVNRGWLRKQVAAGNIEAKCDYHLTDDYAADNANNMGQTDWMPARLRHPVCETYMNEHGYARERLTDDDFKEGMMNFTASDFKTKSGAAWKEANGTISLIVHSNASYTLRVKQAPVSKPRIRRMAIAQAAA